MAQAGAVCANQDVGRLHWLQLVRQGCGGKVDRPGDDIGECSVEHFEETISLPDHRCARPGNKGDSDDLGDTVSTLWVQHTIFLQIPALRMSSPGLSSGSPRCCANGSATRGCYCLEAA